MPSYILQNRLKELMAEKGRRERRKITQTLAAEETGLSRYTIDHWARNEVTRMDYETVAILCTYLNCQPGDLLVLVDEGQHNTPLPDAVAS